MACSGGEEEWPPARLLPQRPELPTRTPRAAREVTLTVLRRRTSEVLAWVGEGDLVVIGKHGRPIALIAPFSDPHRLLPAEIAATPGLGELAQRFERRQFRREWDALFHGRWYGPRQPPRW